MKETSMQRCAVNSPRVAAGPNVRAERLVGLCGQQECVRSTQRARGQLENHQGKHTDCRVLTGPAVAHVTLPKTQPSTHQPPGPRSRGKPKRRGQCSSRL